MDQDVRYAFLRLINRCEGQVGKNGDGGTGLE